MSRTQEWFSIALLVVAGLILSSVPLHADDAHERCERRIHKAEQKLHEAVRRHGEHSRQARQRREQLEDARRKCGYDRDHDRDHDHDHS